MNFKIFGKEGAPKLMLIPGLGVSYEIFLPLIEILEEQFHIIAVQVDGFTLGRYTEFTSVEDQAIQVSNYIKENCNGNVNIAYGLSLGGKILSQVLERDEVTIDHAILDAAPLLPLPKWLVSPLKHLQSANVWTCYHWTGFWRWAFHSHYFDVLLDECRKVFPYGGTKAVLDGYTSVYTTKLENISGNDIHYWHGTKESFVAKPQVKHLNGLFPNTNIEVFKGMNHGQLLIDHPEEVAQRIIRMNCKMQLVEISDRTEDLIELLTQVWEKSVKATHLFLSEDEIAQIRKFVPGALSQVANLIIAINETGDPIGFSVYNRSETDEEGRPYPLLYMKR